MSVMQPPSFNLRRPTDPAAEPSGAGGRVAASMPFDELEVTIEPDGVTFQWEQDNQPLQIGIMAASVLLYMLFIVSIVPLMQLSAFGSGLAVVLGLIVLAVVGVIGQARLKSTTVRLGTEGVRIQQGNLLDREIIQIAWDDLRSVELEPVDPKSERAGMQLEIMPREGAPVRVLPGVGVGDLSNLRQAILKARRGTGA